ncbi:hypothetical protein CsSME_00020501 [Camellia sinensis var. sinensis]
MEAALDRRARFMVDDLLNFTLDAGDEDDDDENNNNKTLKPLSSSSSSLESSKQDPDDHQTLSLTEFAEEELEWLSNKDAFPAVETCLDILSDNPGIVQSPASVLENSSTTSTSTSNSSATTVPSCCARSILVPVPPYPGKARSRRRRRRRGFSDLPGQQWWSWSQDMVKSAKKGLPKGPPPPPPPSSTIGRKCQHCQADKTPQWRAGPMGPKTLCNACGVRYKSGRLVPEYRPASSPTFSSVMHSNSHRKIIEMRRQRYGGGE